MKKNKLISSFLAIVLLAFSFTSFVFAETPETVVDIAVGVEGEFTVLEAALVEAGLVTTLQGEGPFTVFAPTDAAFQTLLTDLGIGAEDLLGHPQLADVLLYHVVSGKVMSTDLADGQVATVLGENISIDAANFKVNSSNILVEAGLFDLEAGNGVVHVIDAVLVPDSFVLSPEAEEEVEETNTIVDIALADDNFSILVQALQKAGLVEALQGEGPFTVFAPTNDAFVKLLGALGIEAEDLLGHPQLADVLLYHVVSGKVLSTDLSDGLEATTLQGEKLLVDLSDGVKINESTVVSADIEADNGVIHVIDTVLVPEAFVLAADDSAQEDVPKMGDIGVVSYVLLGALGATGLVAVKKRKHNK